MKKSIFFCVLLAMGCNHIKDNPQDILHPQFNLTFDGLLKDGFVGMPEDVLILGKQIGDTLLHYQFDNKATGKSKPLYMFCAFPIKSINTDSIERFFWGRSCFRICEYQNDDFSETFYVKHQFKRYIYQVIIDKKKYRLSVNYAYPEIDD